MTKQLTLSEFFNQYPISIQYIATKMGIDRTTLSKKVKGTLPVSKSEIHTINTIIREIGKEFFWVVIK